jgi:hypothetical protein
MSDITLLPSAKVPLIYPDTNGMTTEWYRFFWNIYGFTGTGVVPVNKGGTGLDTIGDHQIIIGNTNNVFEPASLSSASIAITYPIGYVNLELAISSVIPSIYGSASQVGVFTVNQYGILTAASNASIAIDANQITSGTIASARISGSYTGITGVGTLTAGTWNATTIDVVYGGTGQTSFTNGQLLIGNTTGNTLTKATLTAGTGVTITNGAGSITISATGSGGTVTAVTGTSPVVSSGGTTPAISMAAATGSVNGYLTSTDWSTFNGKAPAVTYTTGYVPYGQGTTSLNQSSALTFDGTKLSVTGEVAATKFTATGGSSNGFLVTGSGSAISIPTTGLSLITGYGVSYLFSYNSGGAITDLYINASLCYYQSNAHVFKNNAGTNEIARLFGTGGFSIGNTTDPGTGNLSVTGTIRAQGYTVATLPAAGTVGRTAYVTDALAPTFLTAIVGGGAIKCPVFDNGTAWVAG